MTSFDDELSLLQSPELLREAHFLENHTYAMTQNNHEEYVEKNDIS